MAQTMVTCDNPTSEFRKTMQLDAQKTWNSSLIFIINKVAEKIFKRKAKYECENKAAGSIEYITIARENPTYRESNEAD